MALSTPQKILILPGLLHTPAHFASLITTLQASHSIPARALQMPNYGATASNSQPGDDVRAARVAVEDACDEGYEVTLLGHSYTGIVAAQAVTGFTRSARQAQGKRGAVVAAVWLAAFVIPDGVSTWEFLAGQLPPPWARREGDLWFPNPEVARVQFFADLSESEGAMWAERLVPAAHHHCTTPMKGACWGEVDVRKVYITTLKDPALPVQAQRGMMAGMDDGTWEYREIESAHAPFLSRVDEFAGLLAGIVRGS